MTLDDYRRTVRFHLSPRLGRKRLANLTVRDVDELWAAKRAAGYKPNSVRIMRAVLRRPLAQAQQEGLVSRNSGLNPPREIPHRQSPSPKAIPEDRMRRSPDRRGAPRSS